jgi:hypothetical protein
MCIAVAMGLASSCSIDQTTASPPTVTDAGEDGTAFGGSGGTAGDGAAGWAGYGATGGDPACDAKTPGSSQLSDLQFVYHAIQTVLGEKPDAAGFELRLNELRSGTTRAKVYEGLCATKEMTDNPVLQDKAGFVERVYGVLLGRAPTASETAAAVLAMKNFDGKGPGSITWYEEFLSVLAGSEYFSIARPLIGVHFPTPVDPVVAITDADFVRHSYRVLFDREYDLPGFLNYTTLLETNTRPWLYQTLTSSGEFLAKPALADKSGFVGRVYQVVLNRAPTPLEVIDTLKNLQSSDGTGGGKSWYSVYQGLIESDEFKQKNCEFEYFVYDAPLATDVPSLRDVVGLTARIAAPEATQAVTLTFDGASGTTAPLYQKLVTFVDRESKDLYGFSRGRLSDQSQNIFLLRADNAEKTSFVQVGAALFQKNASESYLDPELAIDTSMCPRRYVMGMTCPAGACVSHSTSPTVPETWSRPRSVVTNCPAFSPTCSDHHVSAVSSVVMLDHGRAYLAWAEMDDGTQPYVGAVVNPDDGPENTSTNAQAVEPYAPVSSSVIATPKKSLLAAEPNPKCQTAWDCDSRSISDWRVEGAQYFALYSGANYYRCKRPDVDTSVSNQWGIGVAYSLSPLESYERPKDESVVFAKNAKTCAITYPVLSVIDGKLFVHYTHTDEAGAISLRRAGITCQ